MRFSKNRWYWAVIYDIAMDIYSIEKCKIQKSITVMSPYGTRHEVYLISDQHHGILYCAEEKIFEKYCDAQNRYIKLQKEIVYNKYRTHCSDKVMKG